MPDDPRAAAKAEARAKLPPADWSGFDSALDALKQDIVDEVYAAHDVGYDAGVAAERTRIVAWLRDPDAEPWVLTVQLWHDSQDPAKNDKTNNMLSGVTEWLEHRVRNAIADYLEGAPDA